MYEFEVKWSKPASPASPSYSGTHTVNSNYDDLDMAAERAQREIARRMFPEYSETGMRSMIVIERVTRIR